MSSVHPAWSSRVFLARALSIALLLAPVGGCDSDGDHRDQNYGTDVGANYQLPDGGARDSGAAEVVAADVRDDATPESAGPDAAPADASTD